MRSIALSLMIFLAACSSACSGGAGPGQDAPAQPVGTAPAPQPAPPLPPSEARPVVFMGDSITKLWESLPYINAGINGQTSAQMLERFEVDVLSKRPSVVVILAGTNDVFLEEFPAVDNVGRMADMAAASGACVILGTLPPAFIAGVGIRETVEENLEAQQRWNADIKMLAQAHTYRVADYRTPMEARPELFADTLHPNADGYAVMLGVVQPLVDECLAR